MARQKVFVVYDSKVGAYVRTYHARTTAEGLRIWQYLAETKAGDNAIAQYPADHTLFESAEFDDHTGRFFQKDAMNNLGTAQEILSASAQSDNTA